MSPPTNDQNIALARAVSIATENMPSRRVLGDVSPNVKMAAPAVGILKNKPLAGSPLKRSFTAMVEDGTGFSYLKRRKLSGDEALDQGEGATVEQSRSVFGTGANGVVAEEVEEVGFRPLHPILPDETPDPLGIPTVQEPDPEPSPTEPNTPTSSGSGEDQKQHSSAERKSFSSLINYDPSSQTSNLVISTAPTSRAELLKLRLRVAMYKVRTNQINIPFSDLKLNKNNNNDSLSRNQMQATSQAVEEAVASLRREAQAMHPVKLDDRPFPKLLQGPVLKPTAYSSRMIYEPLLPSSPPGSRSPERRAVLPQQVATPARAVRQLSSPPDSAGRLAMRPEEAELTSSVVKGRVAEGLLDLRHAV